MYLFIMSSKASPKGTSLFHSSAVPATRHTWLNASCTETTTYEQATSAICPFFASLAFVTMLIFIRRSEPKVIATLDGTNAAWIEAACAYSVLQR